MRVYVVVAMHGDEVFGLKIAGELQKTNHTDLKIRVGHPEAVAKRQRYLETDMNRSFSDSGDSIESLLAKVIQAEIEAFDPDCIIDVHTSVSNVKKVGIAAQISKATKKLASNLSMDAVVVMPKDIARNSLIGRFPSKAISIEFGKYQRSDKLAKDIAARIASLDSKLPAQKVALPTYRVSGTIPKDHPELNNISNLEFNPGLGGYPFLAGKNTYETIGGFLAQKIS